MKVFFFPFLIAGTLILSCLFSLIIQHLVCAVVREKRGPYNDPQHPYFYEGEDVWMVPGFINQFHEVSLIGNALPEYIAYLHFMQ